MKKFISILTVIIMLVSVCALSGCKDSAKDDKTIIVGASSTPHAEILATVKDALRQKGYKLIVKEYDDYVLPNKALQDGEIDANYFQHKPYLDSFNESNDTDLVSAAAIHYEPFGIYGNGVDNLKNLVSGATVIIPADDSNETRALLLLAQEGLIKLKDGANAAEGITTYDIVDNGGYDIQAVQADTVPAQFQNASTGSIAVINGNYALAAGLKVKDALATEDANGDAAQTYANIIAVKKGNEESEKIKALIEALETDEVRSFIDETYDGAVMSIF